MLPLVIAVHSPDGQIRRYAFADSPISVGRSPLAELQLNEPSVSRWEGTLRFDEREVTYFSLGSSNPTLVNSRQATAREDIPIAPGTVLTVGRLQLRFTREPVAEAALRAKGKRRPVQDDASVNAPTQFLRTPSLESSEVQPLSRATRGVAASSVAQGSTPSSSAKSEPVVRVLSRVAISKAESIALAASSVAPVRAGHQVDEGPASERSHLDGLYRSYRSAAGELVMALRRSLESGPASSRTTQLEGFRSKFPEIFAERELASALAVHGLEAPHESAALRDWLNSLSGSDHSPRALVDAPSSLHRAFALLETLVQSLAEIHHAQNAVRRKWLGRSMRETVLSADNPKLLLAQLLTPESDRAAHMAALEEVVRGIVTHELALFRATLQGARMLLLELAPEKLAQEEGLGCAGALERAAPVGLLGRLFARRSTQARLWARFAGTFEALFDGAQYQRVFLGREFARTYMAAMGALEQH